MASISGIFSQLDAAGVAETLEELQLIASQRGKELVYCPVGFCVQINNAIATFFCRSQNSVR